MEIPEFRMVAWIVLLGAGLTGRLAAEERTERFDRDPGWEGQNNRSETPDPRTIRQDFGFSATDHAGGKAGEIGGFISPAAEPSYYARVIPQQTFHDNLSASGTIACDGRPLHALVGFFNAETLNEWRTPNTIALRISGRGDVFYAWVEYATSRWRAGGDDPQGFPTRRDPKTGKAELIGFPSKAVHRWSLRYEPEGKGGVITATIDDQKAVCRLQEGHKRDGATFNRFGLMTVMKSGDQGGEVWLDDLTINGQSEDFDKDPGWDHRQNRRTYVSTNVRPRFDFGFSPTQFAGGRGRGELGGLVFRGDCRYPEKMASYGDRLRPLNLEKPLWASGKVCLRRGVTDSTILIGFFNARESMAVNPSQDHGLPRDFLGAAVEGPSREGFYFAPAYRVHGDQSGWAQGPETPHIYPDGEAHDWTLKYDPAALDGRGRITLTLDKQAVHLGLGAADRATGAQFDRFGIITTWIDGNGQHIYFDDLTYTSSQD